MWARQPATTADRSSRSSTSSTHTSVNRLRSAGGSSRLPASVAGFMAPNSRNDGCGDTRSASPFSVSVMPAPSSRPASRWSVSGDARLTSSSSTQWPWRTADTNAPSTNWNAKAAVVEAACPGAALPPSDGGDDEPSTADRCRSNAASMRDKAAQSAASSCAPAAAAAAVDSLAVAIASALDTPLDSLAQSPRAHAPSTAFRKPSLAASEKVRRNKAEKVAASGTASCFRCTGL